MTAPDLPEQCCKCGYFANWTGPTYGYLETFGASRHEWLEWKCIRCGYTVKTSTRDRQSDGDPCYDEEKTT